jgi:hypothetical protein
MLYSPALSFDMAIFDYSLSSGCIRMKPMPLAVQSVLMNVALLVEMRSRTGELVIAVFMFSCFQTGGLLVMSIR